MEAQATACVTFETPPRLQRIGLFNQWATIKLLILQHLVPHEKCFTLIYGNLRYVISYQSCSPLIRLSEVRSVKLLSWDQSQGTIKRAIYHSRWKMLTVMIIGHTIDVLIVVSTVYEIDVVNFKWNACKMNLIAKISCYFERSVVTLKLGKEYLNTVTHMTPVLLRIKYWTVWYIERYSMSTHTGVSNFQKTVRFFGPPCIT